MRGLPAALALFAVAVLAAPPEKRDALPQMSLTKQSTLVKDGVVDVQALMGHVAFLQSKYSRTLATYEKNTGSPHPNARLTSTKKGPTGSDPLTDYHSELWYGQITVGSSKFTVDFDTGSSDLFLPGPKCGSTCDGHKIYSTKGAKDAKETFTLRYGNGSATVSGEVFIDSVTIAGLTAKNQALGAAKQYSSEFQISQFPADGLLGLAYPQLAVIKTTKPTFNTLINNHAVASGQFGFKLSSSGAVFYLGGIDPSYSSKDLTNVPVTHQAFWQVRMDSVNVGGSVAVKSTEAIIDTGTTLILGDPKSVSQLYAKIPGSRDASSTLGPGLFTFPCNSRPKVSMVFGKKSFDISSTFNLGAVKQGSSDCVGGIVGQDTGLNAWVVGDVFLANVYAQFSFDHNTVGFAKQR